MLLTKQVVKMAIVLSFFVLISNVFSANTGNISGKVLDDTGELLYGANVMLMGTSMGAATDIVGNYYIKNVSPGSYTLQVSYLGYQSQSVSVEIKANDEMEVNFELLPESLEGETVVVTAQAKGQQQAINQQLTSQNIKNVVSSARIREVPDRNAAESVGRLPGVSVLRSGGEGEKVVVRGMAPKYNAITLNGVRLSASDAGDRGADLSMISSNMLDGIQVSKTITSDMDANAIGGVVNFSLREAEMGIDGAPKLGFVLQGGRNGLENAKDALKNYKVEGIFESRFFDNDFGLFLQASYEERNLSSNELGATYRGPGSSQVDYVGEDVTLDDIVRLRTRAGAVLSLDYQLEKGKLQFSNLFSNSVTESNDRQQFYNIDRGINTQNFNALYRKSDLNTISNILNFEHELWSFNMNASLSHTYSETKSPKDWTVNFVNPSAGISEFGTELNLDPRDVVSAANNDVSSTILETVSTDERLSDERALRFSLDFDTQFNFSDMVSAVIKFGGSYTHQTRSYDVENTSGQNFGYASGANVIASIQEGISWFNHVPGDNTKVPYGQFIDPNFDYGIFIGGEYAMVYPMNFDYLQEMTDYMYANQIPGSVTYSHNNGNSITEDYTGEEDISAAYIMATINIGSELIIIPGVRYQELKTVYTAPQGLQGPTSFSSYAHELITVTNSHPYWLPAISLQYKPLNWFDIRLAYSNTLSYPDYRALSPRINVNLTASEIQYNGFELKPEESNNYDVYLSFYNNTIGLFTIGGFLKQISDVIYQYSFIPATGEELLQYYPDWVDLDDRTPRTGVTVNTYLNNSYQVNNYGIELDWQTHFWYLPSALSGLVLNVNYTHIFSEADYPYQLVEGSRVKTYVDTSYTAPLIFQPDDILNITLGYDYKGFSVRLSSIYTADIFTLPEPRPQVRSLTRAYTRWDLSAKQNLPYVQGLEIFLNWNNFTSADDQSAISAGVPTRIEAYGSFLELGLRGNFDF